MPCMLGMRAMYRIHGIHVALWRVALYRSGISMYYVDIVM